MQDRGVLVTGAARRIGAAIVARLHGAGARVVLHCNRSRDEADKLAGELNGARRGSAFVVQADLLDVGELARLVEDAASAMGGLDALVNNASSFHATPFGTISAARLGRPHRHEPARAAHARAGGRAPAATNRRARSSTSPTSTPSAR